MTTFSSITTSSCIGAKALFFLDFFLFFFFLFLLEAAAATLETSLSGFRGWGREDVGASMAEKIIVFSGVKR